MKLVHRARRRRVGFTLTEIAIVLGIIGTLLGAVWAAASHVSSSKKVQMATQEVMLIVSGYKKLYAGGIDNSTQWNPVTCMGVSAGYFPSGMLPSGTNCTTGTSSTYPKDPWGNPVNVVTWQADNLVLVAFQGLSKSDCNALANSLYTAPNIIFENIFQQTVNADGSISVTNNGRFIAPCGNIGGNTCSTTGWSTTDVDGLCVAGNINNVQVGYSAR